jgi:hypothetical protein
MSPQNTNLAPEPPSDVTVHIVLDDFGKSGRAYRETAEEAADFNTVIDPGSRFQRTFARNSLVMHKGTPRANRQHAASRYPAGLPLASTVRSIM